MPLSIAAIALLGVGLLGLGAASALLLGAALAPTDPVLASSVQVGPPQVVEEDEVRFALTSEARHGSAEETQHDVTSDGRAVGLNCYANRKEGCPLPQATAPEKRTKAAGLAQNARNMSPSAAAADRPLSMPNELSSEAPK
jgi:hypothetical protein